MNDTCFVTKGLSHTRGSNSSPGVCQDVLLPFVMMPGGVLFLVVDPHCCRCGCVWMQWALQEKREELRERWWRLTLGGRRSRKYESRTPVDKCPRPFGNANLNFFQAPGKVVYATLP